MSRLLIILLSVLLVACASIDRGAMTQFEPLENGFKYTAKTDVIHRQDDPESEQQRIEWLKQYLSDNRICERGYTINDRKVIAINSSISNVFYYGRCM